MSAAPLDTAPPPFSTEGAEVTRVFRPNLEDLSIRRSDAAPEDAGALLDADALPDVDQLPDDLMQLLSSIPPEEDASLSFDDDTRAYSYEQLVQLSKEAADVAAAHEEVTLVCPAPSEVECCAPRSPRPASLYPGARGPSSETRPRAQRAVFGLPAWAVGLVVATALGLLLTGVVAFGQRGFRSESVRSRATTSNESVPAAPAPPSASQPAPVRVVISASPPETRLFLDNQPVSNPFDELRAPEGKVHMLRAEAPGRSTLNRAVTLDRDLAIFLELGQ